MPILQIYRFRYFFHKRNSKNDENNRQPNEEDARGIVFTEARRDEGMKRYGSKKCNPMQRRTSESISNDPTYLNKLFGIKEEGTIRLFNQQLEEENYFPDEGSTYKRKGKTLRSSLKGKNTNNLQVYTASVTRNSKNFSPPRPSEPFPYKVYNSVPRRSTMQYGVDYEGNPLQSDGCDPRISIKSNGSASANTSHSDGFNHLYQQNRQDDKERSVQQERRVTIVAPNEMGDIPPVNNYENIPNDLETDSVRKTVLRFRPHSSVSRHSRESVKLMVYRSDQIEHPPLVLSRHVHQFPLKRIKRMPVLMMDDGRLLKPLDTDKPTRNSSRGNKEENRVRVSMADIENICKVQINSTEKTNPVKSRNSTNRNSIRQSLISRQIVNDKRSSILREPEKSYQYILEQNEPVVYGVPVTPSRIRSNSQVSRQSITSYDPKSYQRLDNDGYYVDESYPVDKDGRYSRGSYQSDCIIMKKEKPIVVYEVHNFENNNCSISRNSIVKNEDLSKTFTKSQRNSTQKSVVTNQPMNPQVEIIYQEPKTQLQPIKEKQRFRNKFKIQKSSENSINDSGSAYQNQPIVYVAGVPSGTLPASKIDPRKFSFNNRRSKTSFSTAERTQSKDFCGLTCEPQGKSESLRKQTNSNIKTVSSSQQTDFENDIDFLCYPAEKLPKTPTNFPESDSKLKWRIIIKK